MGVGFNSGCNGPGGGLAENPECGHKLSPQVGPGVGATKHINAAGK